MGIDGYVSTPADASSSGPVKSTGSADGCRCSDATATAAAESKSVIESSFPLESYSSLDQAYCALYS
jgi:hypothetical protein